MLKKVKTLKICKNSDYFQIFFRPAKKIEINFCIFDRKKTHFKHTVKKFETFLLLVKKIKTFLHLVKKVETFLLFDKKKQKLF